MPQLQQLFPREHALLGLLLQSSTLQRCWTHSTVPERLLDHYVVITLYYCVNDLHCYTGWRWVYQCIRYTHQQTFSLVTFQQSHPLYNGLSISLLLPHFPWRLASSSITQACTITGSKEGVRVIQGNDPPPPEHLALSWKIKEWCYEANIEEISSSSFLPAS